jgi:branched-chain amino acid transport system permease protein/neutral amino acid transport system permease protein
MLVWGLFFVKAGIFSGALIILNGIRFGSILMLGAIGLTLTYKILNFGNFSHGDMMMFGAFVAFSFDWMFVALLPKLAPALADPGQADTLRWIAIIISMILGVIVTIGLALLIDRILYRRMRRSAQVVLVIASFGMALFIRALIQAIWGVGNRAYAMLIKPPMVWFADTPFRITITPVQIVTIIAAILLIVLVHLFLKYSKTGKAMRAMSDNMDLAKASGINTERMIQWTWALGAGLAAIAGVFFGLN